MLRGRAPAPGWFLPPASPPNARADHPDCVRARICPAAPSRLFVSALDAVQRSGLARAMAKKGKAASPPRIAGAALAFLACCPDAALAHASERGFVLLLPTTHYLVGGALAVALTFVVLLFVPPRGLETLAARRLPLFSLPRAFPGIANWTSFLALALLLCAGFSGSRDPLDNPLPLTVWTLFWIGVPLVQGTLGDVWSLLDPWAAPCRLASRLGLRARWRLPSGLGVAPALPLLFLFIWFELIDPAPDDPARLAAVLAAYWIATFAAMLLVGHRTWSRQGEVFSVLFGMLARFAVTETVRGKDGRRSLAFRLPGAKLRRAPALPLPGTLFLLLALAGVAFDGFSKTFLYLGLIGVNPLEHPGRSSLVLVNTAGLALAFATFAALFLGGIRIGQALAGSRGGLREEAGLAVWSLVPIALAYQFAHYLTGFLVNAQYWLVSLSDPLERGWNLFGTARLPVRAAVAAGSDAAWAVWNAQAAAIVGAHVLAVAVAHGLAGRLHPERGRAAFFLLPLTLLMVFYTVFGLWLLSTPTGA